MKDEPEVFYSSLRPHPLLDSFPRQLLFERGGDCRIEAGLWAGLFFARGGDVGVALFGEGDDLCAQLLTISESLIDLALPLCP